MKIVIEEDSVTTQTKVTEKNCSEEFIFSAIACYMGIKCRDMYKTEEESIHMLENIKKVAEEIVCEKYHPISKPNGQFKRRVVKNAKKTNKKTKSNSKIPQEESDSGGKTT